MPSPRGPKPELEKEIEDAAAELISEAEYAQIVQALKDQAISGDAVARRQLIELHNANKAASAMDFVLNIVPYDIADKSLKEIVEQADTPIILEIIAGLANRLEHDHFSDMAKKTLMAFRRLFTDEAADIYKPAEDE
jgi:hypothetical protein